MHIPFPILVVVLRYQLLLQEHTNCPALQQEQETFRSHNHKIMAHYAFLNSNNIVTEVITGVEEGTADGYGELASVKYGKIEDKLDKKQVIILFSGTHTLGGTPFRGNYG